MPDGNSGNSWVTFLRTFYVNRKEHILFILSLIAAAIISTYLLGFFLELVDDLEEEELKNLDERVTEFVFRYRSDSLTSVLRIITFFGDRLMYLILGPCVGIILYIHGTRWNLIIQGVLILLSAALINIWLKMTISRPRPLEELHLVQAHSFSFPSGHSMSAVVFYGFLIYLSFKFIRNHYRRILVVFILSVIILLVGISRIYLGVHYPSDVLAGFAAGLCWLILCISVFRAFNYYFGHKLPFV